MNWVAFIIGALCLDPAKPTLMYIGCAIMSGAMILQTIRVIKDKE